jgi:hypothetical protein
LSVEERILENYSHGGLPDVPPFISWAFSDLAMNRERWGRI